jgi:hypothetical protein
MFLLFSVLLVISLSFRAGSKFARRCVQIPGFRVISSISARCAIATASDFVRGIGCCLISYTPLTFESSELPSKFWRVDTIHFIRKLRAGSLI